MGSTGQFLMIAACLLIGCSSNTPKFAAIGTGNAGCAISLPSTSSPLEQTVNTIVPGTLPVVFAMSPQPNRVCPGGTVVVEVKITNIGIKDISALVGQLIVGCGGPPELVVGRVGTVDLRGGGSVVTSTSFTIPLFAPGNCGFSVNGYPNGAILTVVAPGT